MQNNPLVLIGIPALSGAVAGGLMVAGFVNLQNSSPGTPDTGNINVNGNVIAGKFGSGVTPSLARVQVNEAGTLQGVRSQTTSGAAVFGASSAPTGLGAGGYFTSNSAGGRAIIGDALSGTGVNVGGIFTSRSTGSAFGVWGRTTGANNTGTGVFGQTVSATGTALAAKNEASSNQILAGTGSDSLQTRGAIPRHEYTANTPRPMVPLAYGVVAFDGSLFLSGSGNWTVSKSATGHYVVTVTGVNMQNEVVSATPTNASGPRFLTLGSVGSSNSVDIFTWDLAGNAVDSAFHFVVYRQNGTGAGPVPPQFRDMDETKPAKTPAERARYEAFLKWQSEGQAPGQTPPSH